MKLANYNKEFRTVDLTKKSIRPLTRMFKHKKLGLTEEGKVHNCNHNPIFIPSTY